MFFLFLWLMTFLLLILIHKEDFKFTYKINVCFSKVLSNRTIEIGCGNHRGEKVLSWFCCLDLCWSLDYLDVVSSSFVVSFLSFLCEMDLWFLFHHFMFSFLSSPPRPLFVIVNTLHYDATEWKYTKFGRWGGGVGPRQSGGKYPDRIHMRKKWTTIL